MSLSTFTPAPTCFEPTYTVAPQGNDAVDNLTAIRGYYPACFANPPEPTGAPIDEASDCPVGYSRTTSSDATNAGLTLRTCCPSGMSIHPTNTAMCQTVTGYNSVTVVSAGQTSLVHANFLQNPAVVIAYRSEDIPASTSPAMTSGATLVSTEEASVDGNGLHRDAPPDDKAVGAVIGSILGVGVIVLAVVILALLYRQRKKVAAVENSESLPPAPLYHAEPEIVESRSRLPMYEGTLVAVREKSFV